MSIIKHPTLGLIECVRSMRTRSIRLSVRPDKAIRLTYPFFVRQKDAIIFAESKAEWIDKTRQRLEERRATIPTISRAEAKELLKSARNYLPITLARLAEEHGFHYTSLRLTSARTRWGSCSGKNGISLSIFIMQLPPHLREFIILHELCHTRHHNHSAEFHTLLDSHVAGKEKALNRELKAYMIPMIKD
ncbi:MAG: DUF45 domain-containing protein [Alistipes sp.]|nr:DUF45 domain-containing protein [Alistipes sp.]